MAEKNHLLHVVFLPYPAPGHTIPLLDTVRLFVDRGVKTTIITTPLNAPDIAKHLNITKENKMSDFVPNLHIIPFPSPDLTGLPAGFENQASFTSHVMVEKFILSMELFEDPVEKFLGEVKPNCLVSDLFFTFSTNLAKNIGIPRLSFNGTGFFPMCVMMGLYKNGKNELIVNDDQLFTVPNLPHEIKLTKSQIQKGGLVDGWDEFMSRAIMGYVTSFGDVFNTFYELEPHYVDLYKKNHNWRKVWHIGPVSLCNRKNEEKFQRGLSVSICENDCLKLLDSKPANSVIYLSFGTSTHFKATQIREIAIALENVGYSFIWVIRARNKGDETDDEKWLPEGFEKRVKGEGLIIRGWAPQVMILEHEAVAAFVTHCGWNSTLEGFSAGVAMATWPLQAEQFYIEKLVTQVLKVGVEIGSIDWSFGDDGTFIDHIKIEDAIKQIMVGEEALEMRVRAKKLKELAHNCVKQGGSSYNDLTNLLQDLANYPNKGN